MARSNGSIPERGVWSGMIRRCTNSASPTYQWYGGRGITVCAAWLASFEAFLADVGRRPSSGMTLDRIDNARGYEPGNVRWTTRLQNARNRRDNTLISIGGETLCLMAWCERAGLHHSTLQKRLRLGWPAERAVFEPVRRRSA